MTSALRWGWVVNATPRPLYPRERPGTYCTGGWVGPRAGLDGCGKTAPTGIRSPDRPARNESLYRLSYRCSQTLGVEGLKNRIKPADIQTNQKRYLYVQPYLIYHLVWFQSHVKMTRMHNCHRTGESYRYE